MAFRSASSAAFALGFAAEPSRARQVGRGAVRLGSELEEQLARNRGPRYRQGVILRPFLFEETACASYLFGCLTESTLAVVDPHEALVERYLAEAERVGAPIVAVLETHVQADHVSGLPALVEATGATPYLPLGAAVEFAHEELGDGDEVVLGNTRVRALATPGHAPEHNAYVVSDQRRGTEEPWLVFTGDSLLVGDVGRPDLHAAGDPMPLAHELYDSLRRLLDLPDGVLVYPSHYGGSVCGRSLSGNPFSTIGFERRHNGALAATDAEAFAAALMVDLPPPPADQAAILTANRRGAAAARR
jgi:glyoxylase-like metal-dependent hydrolase (beta-lactamase superfamily II)